MIKEIMETWTTALRSGKYLQGRDNLRRGDKYCCFGVLCDLYDSSLWGGLDYTSQYYAIPNGQISFKVVPSKVKEWAGLQSNNGAFDKTNLCTLNDYGASFTEIADTIEKVWEKL